MKHGFHNHNEQNVLRDNEKQHTVIKFQRESCLTFYNMTNIGPFLAQKYYMAWDITRLL